MVIHGLSNCRYVFGGVAKPLDGAVQLLLDPKITVEFDKRIRGGGKGVKYIREGYDGTLELAAVPFSFYTDVLGWQASESTITEIYEAANCMKEFSLLYQSKGRREILWSCSAGAPSVKRKTDGKGIEIITVSIPIYARRDAQKRIRSINCDPASSDYKTYFGMVNNT